MIDGHPHLLDYNPDLGILAIDRIKDDLQGVDEVHRQGTDSGRSIVEPLYLDIDRDVEWFFMYSGGPFATNPNTNIIAFVQPDWAQGNVWSGAWSSGWSIMKPFYMNGNTYMFEYQPHMFEKATVAIDKLKRMGQGFDEVWRSKWTNGWTSIEPFYVNGNAYLVEYKSGGDQGDVAIDLILPEGQGTQELWRGSWNVIWNLVKVFYHGGKVHVLTYASGFNGDWEIHRLRDDLQGFTRVSQGRWNSDKFPQSAWSIIEPFYMNQKVCFFASTYVDSIIPSPTDPTVSIARPTDDLSRIERVWSDQWYKGWTHHVPFYLPPTPFPPVIPG